MSNWQCAGMTYEEILNRYADTVTRLCLVRLDCPADSDDCFQNVFLKLYLHPPKVESAEQVKAWLITVTRHEAANWRRWLRRGDPCSLEALPELAATDETERELLALLRTLPPKYREPLYLFHYEGYAISEIATLLHSNPNTVKTRLSRGREQLRRLLEDTTEKGETA